MCINDDRFMTRSTGSATEKWTLLGQHVGIAPLMALCPVIVVVVDPAHHVAQGDPLPSLQPGQVVYQVVDHLHIPVVVLRLQQLSLFVLVKPRLHFLYFTLETQKKIQDTMI